MNNKKSLIVYELNEVPKKVLDYYLLKRPQSNLSFLYKKGFFKETFTNDIGELHPWSTWPSVHRGVNNKKHGIKFLNQDKDCAKSYPPIWEVLEQSGITIGIFGSLQTYPPYINKKVDFFLPDTFSPESNAFPKKLELFQRFNLSLARRNKAYAGKIKFIDIINLLKVIKSGLVSKSTLFIVLIHVIKEMFDSRYKKRRSNIQCIFAFDAYKKSLKKFKPQYSTFFTNHIAANMHRYWLHTFPNDFEMLNQINMKDLKFNSLNILKAMDIADKQIGYLMKFQESRGGAFWVVSGLGQEAVIRDQLKYQLFLNDENKFLEALKIDKNNYSFLPSMYPDINIKCKNIDSLKILLDKIGDLKDIKGSRIIRKRYENKGNTLNFVFEYDNPIDINNPFFISKKSFSLSELGFKLITRDKGTGYHINKGIFISNRIYEKTIDGSLRNNLQIDIRSLFDMTLNYFGLK